VTRGRSKGQRARMRLKRGQGRRLPRPASGPPLPDAVDGVDELLQTAVVRRTAVVLVVASQFRVEHLLLVFQWRVQMFSTPRGDSDQPSPQTFLHRAHMHREFASPARAQIDQADVDINRAACRSCNSRPPPLWSFAIRRPFHIVGIASATDPVDMPRLVRRKPLQLGEQFALRSGNLTGSNQAQPDQ
jgi:hypothetical protein